MTSHVVTNTIGALAHNVEGLAHGQTIATVIPRGLAADVGTSSLPTPSAAFSTSSADIYSVLPPYSSASSVADIYSDPPPYSSSDDSATECLNSTMTTTAMESHVIRTSSVSVTATETVVATKIGATSALEDCAPIATVTVTEYYSFSGPNTYFSDVSDGASELAPSGISFVSGSLTDFPPFPSTAVPTFDTTPARSPLSTLSDVTYPPFPPTTIPTVDHTPGRLALSESPCPAYTFTSVTTAQESSTMEVDPISANATSSVSTAVGTGAVGTGASGSGSWATYLSSNGTYVLPTATPLPSVSTAGADSHTTKMTQNSGGSSVFYCVVMSIMVSFVASLI